MKIITTALEGKGGIGASSTAVNLYIELSKTKKVLMIDLDENLHTTKFFNTRDDKKSESMVYDEIEALENFMSSEHAEVYDFIIIDSGKYISDLNDYALQISDLIIVPTSDSDADYIKAHQFIEKIKEEVISKNDYTEVKLLINRVRYNSTKFHKEMIENYKDAGRVSVFETIIAESEAYKRMSLSGKGVLELTDKVRPMNDIKNLAIEVVGDWNE